MGIVWLLALPHNEVTIANKPLKQRRSELRVGYIGSRHANANECSAGVNLSRKYISWKLKTRSLPKKYVWKFQTV